MKHIVCYSGGNSSALTAIEVVRKYGNKDVILLNHNISSKVEHEDIKRFKREVADYLGIKITYANLSEDFFKYIKDEKERKELMDKYSGRAYEYFTPLKIAGILNGFQFAPGPALCTYNLKTKPFYKYLEDNCTDKENYTIYYGFDIAEEHRIFRRQDAMRAMGYKTDYPLAYWDRTIHTTEKIGIDRPRTYKIFKHANCIGCEKAGRQHWYVVYCLRPDIFKEALETEEYIGHSIIKGAFLKELVPLYEETKAKGICPNDKENSASFWKRVRETIPEQESFLPCDCSFL